MSTTLGSEVRKLREGKRLTQAELAAKSHLGMNFIWGVENDKETVFSYWQIERLAKALEMSEESLVRLIAQGKTEGAKRSEGGLTRANLERALARRRRG